MENPQKKINIDEARLSNLPEELIHRIMDFMTVRDAARTCVLSSKWRCVWACHPSLVLDDDGFWDDIEKPTSLENITDDIYFANIVGSILLLHIGQVRKFVIEVPEYVSFDDLDLWLTSVCRRHLKRLCLNNPDNGDNERYKVPYCVLSNSELTHLKLYYCYIPKAVGCCFSNILKLHLDDVIFHSTLLNTPLLTTLTMKDCSLPYDFEVSAPRLASLTLEGNKYDTAVNLIPFLRCTDINYAYLNLYDGSLQADGKNLVQLLAFWPRISELVVNGNCFKELATGNIPDNVLITPLNLTHFVLLYGCLDSKLITWILYILKSSPFLHTFEFGFGDQVMDDIDEPSMSTDLRMDQLRTVIVKYFTASRNDIMFVKILLKCAPLLGKLIVEENEQLDPNERTKILEELISLQKMNQNTNIRFAPNLVSDE